MKFRERFVSRVSPGLKNPAESFRPAVAHTLPVLFGASSTLLLTRLTFFFLLICAAFALDSPSRNFLCFTESQWSPKSLRCHI